MAIIKKAYHNPLVVFILTIGYGLLKIDVGDSYEPQTYGWIYILIVMWVFVILYIVAYIRVLLYILRKLKNRQQSQYLINTLSVFLIINIGVFLFNPLEIMFGLYVITTYSGLAFVISLVGLTVTGYLLDNEKSCHYFNKNKKNSKLLSMIVPLGIVAIPALTWLSIDKVNEIEQNQEYQQILEKGYQTIGKNYQVKMGQTYPLGKDEVRVEYTLKDGDYEIPSGAELRENNQNSFEIQRSTYVTLEQDYTKLVTIQVNSRAGQEVLKEYVDEINASLKRIKADDKFLVQNDGTSGSIYDRPNFSVIYLNWEQEAPNELKERLAKAKASNEIGQREFDGWVSLTTADLMRTGLLIPEITIDYDWEKNSDVDTLDWDQITSLLREVEAKLISSIDFTQLIDGNYILSGSEDHLLKVKNGQLIGFGEIPSRVVVMDSSDTGFSSSSDYTEWK
jgi:hypothetical protein